MSPLREESLHQETQRRLGGGGLQGAKYGDNEAVGKMVVGNEAVEELQVTCDVASVLSASDGDAPSMTLQQFTTRHKLISVGDTVLCVGQVDFTLPRQGTLGCLQLRATFPLVVEALGSHRLEETQM